MADLVDADRVKETSTTTGTGTYTLGGAVAGFQSFSAGVGANNTCHYVATDGSGWEVGVGTVNSLGTTLARTRIIASSNAGAAVSWAAGTRRLFVAPVADAAERTRVLTADQASTTVTTNVNVAGLSFAVKNGKRYWFEFRVLYRAAATTTGLALSLTVPTFTKFGAVVTVPTSVAADGTANIYRGDITASADQVIGTGTPATGSDYVGEVRGILVPSADGTLQLAYASEVNGSAVTIAQGSAGKLMLLE